MLPRHFDYLAPATVGDAVEALATRPGARFTAGSYRMIIDLKMRRIEVDTLVDLRRIEELQRLDVRDDRLEIGAMVTLDTLAHDPRVEAAAALARAAALTGDPQIRNMAALGGTLAYDASESDVAAALLALGAEVRVAGVAGERTLAAADFFVAGGDGGATALLPNEIVTRVIVPVRPGSSSYARFTHPASLAALIGVAAALERDAAGVVTRCALAVSGTVKRAWRLAAAETELGGSRLDPEAIRRAAAVAADGVPWSVEPWVSPTYRGARLAVMLERVLRALA